MESIFTTARLGVRQLVEGDLDNLYALEQQNNRGGDSECAPPSKQQVWSMLAQNLGCYQESNNQHWCWAVEELDTGRFIGTALILFNQQQEHELDVRLMKWACGQGYGKELTLAMIDYAIEQLTLSSLVAYIDPGDPASTAILAHSRLVFDQQYLRPQNQAIEQRYFWQSPSYYEIKRHQLEVH